MFGFIFKAGTSEGAQKAWAARLENNREIADYITRMSPQEVDSERIEDNYIGAKATLKRLPIGKVKEGDRAGNQRSAAKEKAYAKKKTTMPPIVVENGVVVDGNHRLRVARARGDKDILAYDIEDK